MKADILACYGSTWIDILIQKVIGEHVTHIAIAIDEDFVMETGWFGVKLTKKAHKYNDYYILRYPDLTEEQKNAIVKFVMNAVDTKYDYKLFLGIGLNRLFGLRTNWDNPKKYICVELIIEAFRKVLEIELVDWKKDDEIIPSDLMYTKKLIQGE